MDLGIVRHYGDLPYKVAVLHGGPGAPGYMMLVARELSKYAGIIEPMQSKDWVDGQIDELREQLKKYGEPPFILIGSSWGAVLALLTAARHEIEISKLILIGSAVYDAESSAGIEGRRLERLTQQQRDRYIELVNALQTAEGEQANKMMAEWAELFSSTDFYDPITTDLGVIETQHHINFKVWPEFAALRDKPGYLKSEFSTIDIPTVVIHGDHDPHPIDGIWPFLQSCIPDIKLHILKNCGHYPWVERHAKDRFYEILREEIV